MGKYVANDFTHYRYIHSQDVKT